MTSVRSSCAGSRRSSPRSRHPPDDSERDRAMRRLAFLFALAGTLAARGACAQIDPWEFEVYPVQTLGKGVLEIESLNSVVADGHGEGGAGTSAGTYKSQGMWRTAIELTYGLTDKIEAAAYLNLAKPDGAPFQYAGSKFR